MRALLSNYASVALALFLAGFVLASTKASSADRVALIVGNGNYPDSDAPLATPAQDANSIGTELRSRGFSVDLHTGVTKRALRDAGERLLATVRPGSTVVVYFGGYGIQVSRQNYLVPIDAQIWTESDVQRDGLSLERLLGEVTSRGARSVYVLLDAAYRNPFERRFRNFSTGLAPMGELPPNTFVMFSAPPGVVTRQGTGPESVFAAELVKQIQLAAGISQQVLEQARTSITRVTRDDQMPWLFSPPRDALPPPAVGATAGLGSGAGPSTRPAAPSESTEPPPGIGSGVFEEFQKAKQAGTKQAWQAFIGKHKEGSYSDLARAELARLDAAAPKKSEPHVLPYSSQDEGLLKHLSQRIDRNPNDSAALYTRGQIYAVHEDFKRALADFDRVVRLNSGDVEALNNRCWIRAILGALDDALADCNEALKLRPKFLDALDSRGFVNLKLGFPRSAVADYDAALTVDARHASALYGRGLGRLRTGEATEGNNDIARALAINPRLAEDFARFGVQ
jgi:hypothetical protein